MELCTARSMSTLPKPLSSFPFKPNYSILLPTRSTRLSLHHHHHHVLRVPRATMSEDDSSSGASSKYVDSVVIVEEGSSPVERDVNGGSSGVAETEPEVVVTKEVEDEASSGEQPNALLDSFDIKFDSQDTYSILLYAGGALVTLYLVSAVVRAIDSVPLLPNLMEIVGIGYSFWFATRYLLFKKERDDLIAKIEELKQEVLGFDEGLGGSHFGAGHFGGGIRQGL